MQVERPYPGEVQEVEIEKAEAEKVKDEKFEETSW